MNMEFVLQGRDQASQVIEGSTRKMGSAFDRLRQKAGSVFSKIKNSVFSLQGAFGAVGVAALGKSFLDTATQFENFNTQLVTIEGSSQKAKTAMDWITKFTAKTPYELAEVTEAYTRLRSYGIEPTNGILETLGNTASAMNKPLMQAIEAMADAVTGENERLKEFGIKAKIEGDKVYYAWSDASGKARQSIAENNAASIQSTLEAIWNEKFSGGMDRMTNTWSGMMSNLKDQWELFKLRVMESGVFDYLKESLGEVLNKINEWAQNGQLQAWAESIGASLKEFFETAKSVFTFIRDNWEMLKVTAVLIGAMWTVTQLATFASSVSTLIGLFGSLKTAAVAVNAVEFGGILKNLDGLSGKLTSAIGLLGKAGLVGAAGAVGYGVGTALDRGYTAISGQSLGGDIYDALHPEPQPRTVIGYDGDAPVYQAKGGVIAGGATHVIAGEAGPEAFVPLPDGRSIPVSIKGGGGGGGDVIMNFPNAVLVTKEAVREIVKLLGPVQVEMMARGKA